MGIRRRKAGGRGPLYEAAAGEGRNGLWIIPNYHAVGTMYYHLLSNLDVSMCKRR